MSPARDFPMEGFGRGRVIGCLFADAGISPAGPTSAPSELRIPLVQGVPSRRRRIRGGRPPFCPAFSVEERRGYVLPSSRKARHAFLVLRAEKTHGARRILQEEADPEPALQGHDVFFRPFPCRRRRPSSGIMKDKSRRPVHVWGKIAGTWREPP